MFKRSYFLLALFPFFIACNDGTNETNTKKELSMEERLKLDSLSKQEQKRKVDSMKKTNPLLILPPDSLYTGSYVDKYPNGITKFVGFYRLGKRHGEWRSFYPNGEAWSLMHYDKDLREGPNAAYFQNGKMRYDGFYKHDLKDSVWTYYDTLGKVAKKIQFSKDRVVKELPVK